jgi:4-amino-4-deoxy-L-arabinose transferase-like glycosyltransferase
MQTVPSNPATPSTTHLKRVLAIALVCLGLNLGLFGAIAVYRGEYLEDHHLAQSPDGNNYIILGRNFWLRGEYSRCQEAPFEPDVLRTPVYPLFAGGLAILGEAKAIYLAHALLHTGACVLLFLLVCPYFGARAGTWASLLLATDLAMLGSNFLPGSETLFIFLLLAALVCLLPAVLGGPKAARPTITRLVVGGVLLCLATMTRPVSLYLPVLFVGAMLAGGWYHKRLRGTLVPAAVFLVVSYVPVALWILRNDAVCGIPRLTTVDAANTIYCVGGGAYEIHHDVTKLRAEEMISKEFGLPTYSQHMNPHHTGRDIATMDRQLRNATWPVLMKYPKDLAIATCQGLFKASFSHSVDHLVSLVGGEWQAPGLGSLLRAQPEAFRRLWDNGPVLTLAFTFQMAHIFFSLAFAAVGIVTLLRSREWRPFGLFLTAVLAYFYLTVALFGLDTYWRCRIPVLPFLFVLAGAALAWLRTPQARPVARQSGDVPPSSAPMLAKGRPMIALNRLVVAELVAASADGQPEQHRPAMPAATPLLSVIVPVYNEQATVHQLLTRLSAGPYENKEIIVVDDGSSDGTAAVLEQWRDLPGLVLLRHERNSGKGCAIRTGLAHARGEITIIQDADLEYDPADMPALVEIIRRGESDVVYGSRYLAGARLPWSKFRVAVTLLNWMVRILYGQRITDEATCYKAFRTQLLRDLDLRATRFEFCPEVTAKVCRTGHKIVEVPISYTPRSEQQGKKIRWRDGWQAIWTLLVWRFKRCPVSGKRTPVLTGDGAPLSRCEPSTATLSPDLTAAGGLTGGR